MTPFEQNMISIHGNKGRQWLAGLPELVNSMAVHFGLSGLHPMGNLTYNYVMAGLKGAEPVILKLGPDSEALNREARALKAFAGFGAVKLLEEEKGALLLERIMPGQSLKNYFPAKDMQAVRIVCDVMQRLHQAPLPADSSFPAVSGWLQALDQNWEIPAVYLRKARNLKDQLLETSASPVLLHGDLHHDNILDKGNGWVAIDPKGVMGEPLYEAAAFIRNPLPEFPNSADVRDMIKNRIASFTHILGASEKRLEKWCFVQAVLSWVWDREDKTETKNSERLTRLFEGLV